METRDDSSAISPPAVSVVDKKLTGQPGITLLQNQKEVKHINMAEPSDCLGHAERYVRIKLIEKIRASQAFESLDEGKKVLIKKGPVSVETSLKKLEENYASTSSWKIIEDGGVLTAQCSCGGLQDD